MREVAEVELHALALDRVAREGRWRVDLLALHHAPATESEPALHIERMHRMAFVERVPQQGYLRFASACAARATDCAAGVVPEECTVWRRCIEQGATCGDNGECTRWELALTAIPVGTMPDGSSPFDASVSRLDAGDDAALDASEEASGADAVSDGVTDARDAAAPVLTRLLAPLSTRMLTSRRPTLRWIPAPDAVSMEVDLCRDRAMTSSCQTFAVASAERFQPATELEPGTWYWRARTTTTGAAQTSGVWQFRLGARGGVIVDTTCSSDFDFNGDGLTDFVVGARNPTSNGVVYFYRSSAMGSPLPITIMSSSSFKPIGVAVANAGDFNGDGLADAVLGAAGSDPAGRTNAGAIRVHFGAGIMNNPRLFEGDSAGDALGRVVDGVGDAADDGHDDDQRDVRNGHLRRFALVRGRRQRRRLRGHHGRRAARDSIGARPGGLRRDLSRRSARNQPSDRRSTGWARRRRPLR